MLKQLIIHNLILIDSLEVSFEQGFNVITGETGAGKSAIMSALKLISGCRADTKMVRKGKEKASVEVLIETTHLPQAIPLLQAAGFAINKGDDLIIKRELSKSGKSRAYINHQMAQITLLKSLGEHLVQIVGQHANFRLYNKEEHRNILDLFGDCTPLQREFSTSFKEKQVIEKKIQTHKKNEAERLRSIERLQREVEEIESVNPKEGEEEELFSEYTLLTNTEEINRTCHELHTDLHGSENSLTLQLNFHVKKLEELTKLAPAAKEWQEALKNASCEMEEVAHSLRSYMGGLSGDPHRQEVVNERLSQIDKLKRKYGPTLEEVKLYLSQASEELISLDSRESEIEDLENRLITVQKESELLAKKLSTKRKQTAKLLQKEMTRELRELNMPKVEFAVEITPQPRTAMGDDQIQFLMAPNVGERMIPIKECASGGEISRLLLAIEKLLSSKNSITTIVFDEIDANIGGETAVVVGKKLKEIGEAHQVMCISHFPQVAKQADHHYKIEKIEKSGRTLSTVTYLDTLGKKQELNRMLGNPVGVEADLLAVS